MLTDVITTDVIRDYLGIDYTDDAVVRNIESALLFADSYLKGSLGENYPVEDPRVQELAKMIVSDVYDNRGLVETMSGNTRKLVDDISWQIRLEMRRSQNE